MIGGAAPSDYLKKLQEHKQVQLTGEAMNGLLASHLINTERLRANDFHGFYKARKNAMLAVIGDAMGKAFLQPTGTGEPDVAFLNDEVSED